MGEDEVRSETNRSDGTRLREKDGEERSRAEEVEDAAAGEGDDDDESGGVGRGPATTMVGGGRKMGETASSQLGHWPSLSPASSRDQQTPRRLSPQCGSFRRRPASVRAPRPCTRLALRPVAQRSPPHGPIISPTAPAVPRSRSAGFGLRYTHRRNLLPDAVANIIVCPIPAAMTVNHALLYVRPVLLAHSAVRVPPPPTTALGQVYALRLLSQYRRGLAYPPYPAFLQALSSAEYWV